MNRKEHHARPARQGRVNANTTPANRELPHPAPEDIRLKDLLHAVSDPVRLGMIRQLAAATGALPCSSITVPVSKSTASHHYRVLRESGLIRQTYEGTAKMTRLRRADLDMLFPGLLDTLLTAAGLPGDRAARRA
ncbi:ArsR/SmtB family transcription factor [Streptomyces mauvecolor]|uniref:ArsR/SmtB family transcription factor n=1 Tax=Streptomyces mauvecolor TaxID=58345 RepID=A0ABV9UJH0_9ACTN